MVWSWRSAKRTKRQRLQAKARAALAEMYRVLRPGGRAVVGQERCGLMEAAGFSRVSGRHVMGAYLTTGYKE